MDVVGEIQTENMVEENNPSVNRRMIPAPLLASVKGFTEGNFDSYFHSYG